MIPSSFFSCINPLINNSLILLHLDGEFLAAILEMSTMQGFAWGLLFPRILDDAIFMYVIGHLSGWQSDLCTLNLISVMLVIHAIKCVLQVRTQSPPFFWRPPRLACAMHFKSSVTPWHLDRVFKQLQSRALPLSKLRSMLHVKLPNFHTVSLILFCLIYIAFTSQPFFIELANPPVDIDLFIYLEVWFIGYLTKFYHLNFL